jgi:hypothetical protein
MVLLPLSGRVVVCIIQNTVNKDIKENSKRFWSYIKSKRQEPAGISPLLDKDEFLHSDSQIKAEILNHQFQSVYTKEDTTTLPDKGNSTIKSMNDIYITENGVIKLLKDLNQSGLFSSDVAFLI